MTGRHRRRPNVLSLLNLFVDLCLLRRGPQDLPASRALLLLVLALDVAAGILLGRIVWGAMGPAVGATLLDVAVLMLLLGIALRTRSLVPRFTQSASALLGVGALFTLLAIPLQPLLEVSDAADPDGVSALVYLLYVVWVQVVYGHILRHTLNLPFGAGIAIALGYTLTSAILVELFFPLPEI
jgi:hypothetical protein